MTGVQTCALPICMISSIGVIIDCTLSDLDIHIPSGIPSAKQRIVAAEIMVTVEIIGSHMSKNPMIKKANIQPIDNLILLDPNQARTPAKAINTGHGVAKSNFSMTIKNVSKGSKNDSMLFPNSLVKSLNAASTQFLELIMTSPGIEMTLFIKTLKPEVFIESATVVDK